MQSIDQVLLFAEVLIYAILMLQVLFRPLAEDAEQYLVAYLGLSVIPTLLWLARLTMGAISLPSVEVISSWAGLLPALAFGALTMAFVRQVRWAIGWLVGGAVLFVVLVALQLGWVAQPPLVARAAYSILWTLGLGGPTVFVLLACGQLTGPLHRNRLRYWVVALALIVLSRGTALAAGFSPRVTTHVLGWAAAGLATYVILNVHPPDLKTLVRQVLHFLALTGVLGLAFFGALLSVESVDWSTLASHEVLLLTGIIAMAMAILLPGLSSFTDHILNRLFFGTDYDEKAAVRHYSQSVSNILDIDRLANVAFDVINDVFDIERGALVLVQHTGTGRSTLLPVRGRGNVPTQLIEVDTFGTLISRFRQSGGPLVQYDIDVLPTYRDIPKTEREWLSKLHMELYVPICSQGEVIGLLALGSKRSGEAFRADDLNLLSTLADQTVTALTNAQLVQDLRRLNLDVSRLNAELDAMNQTKTDFIVVASHELRTPLSQVNGYSQMLAEELSSDSPLSVFVNGLVQGAARLTDVVDVMLDVSQLDAGGLILHRTPVFLSEVIERAINEWSSALVERKHTLTTEDLERLPAIQGDDERLQQIFSQLISNAIKNSPDGGHIEITAHMHAGSSGQLVEVIVQDNGIGIDPADQYKIFDKFYRTGDLMKHSTGKTKFKGAGPGLGLSLVKGIVDAHGGRIWVESDGYNEETCPGSSFHVLLPLEPPKYNPAMADTIVHHKYLDQLGKL